MSSAPHCPACRGAMTEGFVPDTTHGAVLLSQWHPGPPEEYRFFGISAGTKIDRKGLLPLQAWRCAACGLVQFFAFAKRAKR